MQVWKRSRSLISGKDSYISKNINTSLLLIFDDFDWWIWFTKKYSHWLYDIKNELPSKIVRNMPYSRHNNIYEFDSRYHGHIHW